MTRVLLVEDEPDLADPWLDHLAVDFDEDRRWIVMRRGALSIACNLGAEPVTVPVSGDVTLAWGEPVTHRISTCTCRASACTVAALVTPRARSSSSGWLPGCSSTARA